jgi:hypothetical protein
MGMAGWGGYPPHKNLFTQTLIKKIRIWTFLGFEKCPKCVFMGIVYGMCFSKNPL